MDLKKVFVLGTGAFVLVCLALFYVLINTTRAPPGKTQRELELGVMEEKLASLEEAFRRHRVSMKELEQLAVSSLEEGPPPPSAPKPAVCSAAVGIQHAANQGTNMLNVYELLEFENVDGGVWKQGWDVRVDEGRFSASNKLQVFVIPHSHNDPGWIKTFQRYFEDQTKHILDNMLRALSEDPTLRFIWAEISYFDLWWRGISEGEKAKLLRLVKNGQLEFVTGGWVMPDEAASHYYGILTQLREGHQWLQKHLGYVPKNGWAIDPFGMSPTNAYILKRAGLNNMLIQRTHYSVKKHLAKLQELEFKWRQVWDSEGGTDMMCHMMPFYSYDVPHTCGPDPKVCCQFDFKRMRGVSSMTCPWNVPPQPIVSRNVRERSLTLLDQYRKKAMLFKTNVLLIPLGDDFRWEDKPEWDAQVSNYQKIFDYVNSQPELNAIVKFGTLDDYFKALGSHVSSGEFQPNVLSGDFFTYADRDDHYWSGYFTSRPFHKGMDRELMGSLRAAQLLFASMSAELSKREGGGKVAENKLMRSLLGKLIKARRNLSLFQHHDGVAGTSKDHVMMDYAEMLYAGLRGCDDVMEKSLHILSRLKDPAALELGTEGEDLTTQYEAALSKDHHMSLLHHNLLLLDQEDRLVTLFNPSPHPKTQLVTIHVSTFRVRVVDIEGEEVNHEVLPVFSDKTSLERNVFQLNFLAVLKPLEVKHFVVKRGEKEEGSFSPPEITLYNSPSEVFDLEAFPVKSSSPSDHSISISNSLLTLNLDKDGLAESVVLEDGKEVPFRVTWFKYGVSRNRETSGLYLFLPDGEAVPLPQVKPFFRVVKGKLTRSVEVWINQVKHRVTLFNHPGLESSSLHITNTVDIRSESNFELVMRLKSGIKSDRLSYTDLNGFQIIERKRFDKLPIQAQYFPMAAATYVQDKSLRMTVVGKQPLGTASLSSGEIEIMMDRRLMQDDNRGVGQGGKDNVETVNEFKVLFEVPSCEDNEEGKKPPMLSLPAHLSLQDLLHPLRAFFSSQQLSPSSLSSLADHSPLAERGEPLGCDIELVDASMLADYKVQLDDASFLPSSTIGLTLRRVGFDGRFQLSPTLTKTCSVEDSKLGKLKLRDVCGDLYEGKGIQSTLTFVHEGKSLSMEDPILMKPMEVYAFKVFLQNP